MAIERMRCIRAIGEDQVWLFEERDDDKTVDHHPTKFLLSHSNLKECECRDPFNPLWEPVAMPPWLAVIPKFQGPI
jgi:hypothetical protein